MQIRRPLAALLATLALFGGGATLTACGDPSGLDRNDGSTDEIENSEDGSESSTNENGEVPNNSDPEQNVEDSDDDAVDPD